MQALVLKEPGCLSLERVEVPDPGPGELLVEVRAAPTCGTDLKAFLRGHPQIPMPGVFGHEYSGVVVAAGPGAPFASGQEVMGVHSAPCQTCFWCENDQENLCQKIMATKVLGSYAQYLKIPAHIARLNLFPKPAEVGFERAALLEPLACVAHGIEMMGVGSNDRVLIIGPGAVGLMFASILRSLGVPAVTVAGRNSQRLAIAEDLGVQAVYLYGLEPKSAEFDIVIECTGREEIWAKSLDYVRRGGKVVLFGGCPAGSTVSFDTRRVHYDQITLMSPFHFGTRAVRQAREWVLDPAVRLDHVLSGDRALEDAESVFRDLQEGIGIKYIFRP